MVEEISDRRSMVPEIALIALTDSPVAAWMPEICWLISPVALAVCWASAFTSEATMAKPRARRLHGGVEREHIGLARDCVDEFDDVADAARRLRQFADAVVGGPRLIDGIAGHPGRFLHLPADLGHRRRELFGRGGDRLHVGSGLLRGDRDRGCWLLRPVG